MLYFVLQTDKRTDQSSGRFCVALRLGAENLKGISESDVIWALFEPPNLCFADHQYSSYKRLHRHFRQLERTLSLFSF